MTEQSIIPFEGKPIRKVWENDEWWFSIIDIIEVLTDSTAASKYWNALKRREPQVSTICRKMKFLAPDDKMRPTDTANTEGVLRIVMSIPSPKVEPLKLWLAQTGKERIEEMENPELAFDRAREIYKAKGYPEDWIGYREKSILIRKELTEEWKSRGINENAEYSLLTAEIAKATFDLTPTEHKELKGLTKPNQNLRDHMTNLELIFSALSEEITRKVAIRDDANGFLQNREAAGEGGRMAGEARENLEKRLGEKVVSSNNFLGLDGNKKEELPKKKD